MSDDDDDNRWSIKRQTCEIIHTHTHTHVICINNMPGDGAKSWVYVWQILHINRSQNCVSW